MNFNDLLNNQGIDPHNVIIMRHRPPERELRKVLPWLAAEKPNVFNAYQQTQGAKLEKSLNKIQGSGYVGTFIGHEAGKALFIGLYEIVSTWPLARDEYWQVPEYKELKTFGMKGLPEIDNRPSFLWFDLRLTEVFADWKGKLIVRWPPPGLAWWRRSHRNDMSIHAVLEESKLDAAMPDWDKIDLSWDELSVLPTRWRTSLTEWRGIYLIFDESDGKSYVGSASGKENLLGRWQNYAASGHGGNHWLRQRDPKQFKFTILQRVSPDMESDDVIRLESSWKDRLHTRAPFGLNGN